MRFGGLSVLPLPPSTSASVEIARRAAKMPSPVAVPSSTVRWSRAVMVAWWSGVGDTRRLVLPENVTSPRFTPGVSFFENSLAASFAAASRLGETSSACMDRETSITSMITARLRGVLISCVGAARATVRNSSAATENTMGRCRQRDGCTGTTSVRGWSPA